jgi:hypothetical protein
MMSDEHKPVEVPTEEPDLDVLDMCCQAALPSLRRFVANCPDCQGSGEVILDGYCSASCDTCGAVREIIDCYAPPRPQPAPRPVALEEEDDDLLF